MMHVHTTAGECFHRCCCGASPSSEMICRFLSKLQSNELIVQHTTPQNSRPYPRLR